MNSNSKIKTVSQLMAGFCTCLMIALPLRVVWFWGNIEQHLNSLDAYGPTVLLDMQYIELYQLVLAGALDMAGALLLIYGLMHLRSLFKLFQNGSFFTSFATQHMYIFSAVLFSATIVKIVTGILISVLLTIGNPPGQKSLVVSFGSNEIALLFFAGTFLAVTWILKEGQRLSTENAEFV